MSEESNIFIVPPSHSGILDRRITTTSVVIYGLGHLGSWLALSLSKLGVRDITLHDFDTIEDRNISGSVYTYNDMGMTKVAALISILSKNMLSVSAQRGSAIPVTVFGQGIASMGYTAYNAGVGFPYQVFSNFYILATDNAESRKRIVETIVQHWQLCGHSKFFGHMEPVIIDVRSNGAKLAIITLPLRDEEMFQRYLKDLDELIADPTDITCNEANIIQVPLFISAIVTQTITSFVRGVKKYYCYQGSLLDLTTLPYKVPTDSYLPQL